MLCLAFLVFGIWSLIDNGSSLCGSTVYGKMVLAMGIINLIFGFLMLAISGVLLMIYNKNKELPLWLVGGGA